MIKNVLTKYVCPDIATEITNLKIRYESIDKYNKVIQELNSGKRTDEKYQMYFKYDIGNKNFISIWCPFCGDPCYVIFDGVCCEEHGVIVSDCNEMHLSAFNHASIFLLYYEERCDILRWFLTCYDFD